MVCPERRRLLIVYMKLHPRTPEARKAWAEYKTHQEDCPKCLENSTKLYEHTVNQLQPEFDPEKEH